ncbi:MAG: diguanylate cyclase [Ghiorsea sp.]|nr:diguanylate cyclase [Ghiorsea sp.]
MKILIVDDSRTYQALLASYIQDMGYKYVSAMSGKEAIEVFTQEWPDLILLDVTMPGMNGYETARQFRELGDEWAHWVPIIFLSSSVQDKDIVMGIEAGGDDYLAKPISEIVLHAKIKAMMRMADHRRNSINITLALTKANEALEKLSKNDGLTGIPNKRYFIEYMKQEWRRCMGSGLPISLLFIDVDHFKPYNDHYGHLQGDTCLKKVAQALHHSMNRNADIAFRYGGEEFAIVLPEVDYEEMCDLGESVVQVLRDLKLPHAYSSAADFVTISVGGATVLPSLENHTSSIIKQADKGVYKAKESGRNCFIAT